MRGPSGDGTVHPEKRLKYLRVKQCQLLAHSQLAPSMRPSQPLPSRTLCKLNSGDGQCAIYGPGSYAGLSIV